MAHSVNGSRPPPASADDPLHDRSASGIDEIYEALADIANEQDITAWFESDAVHMLAVAYSEPRIYGFMKAAYKRQGGNQYDLEKAVVSYRTSRGVSDAPPGQTTATYDPFIFTDAAAILASPVQPRRWLLPGIIADGLTIIGGSPKGGKTYLAYALALAVAQYGTWCQHWHVEQGNVIYISLEDDANDTHLRLLELDPDLHITPGKLRFVHGQDAIPSFGDGLREWLEDTLETYKPRLLIIDPISYLYVLKKSGNQFEETKDMLFPLQWLGKQHQCAIVCLDHRRKQSREDVSMVDTLYGSVAKQAVPSGIIMVKREETDLELDLTIRNGKQQKVYLSFTFEDGRCFLQYKGEPDTSVKASEIRMRLLAALRKSPYPMTIPELLVELDWPDSRQTRNQFSMLLLRGVKDLEVERLSRGRYLAKP